MASLPDREARKSGEYQTQNAEDELELIMPPGSFKQAFDSTPQSLTSEMLMGQLPAPKDRILDEEIQKLDCEGCWHNRRVIVTSTEIVLTRVGEDVVRDSIPLHEIFHVHIPDRTYLAQSGITRDTELLGLQKDKLSVLLGEDKSYFYFEIMTDPDGYNSGITYKMRNASEQAHSRIVSGIESSRRKLLKKLRRQQGYFRLTLMKLKLR
jgi:hypothetical protein